ncbi:MAG: hypothetical protein ABS98_12795 [Lysobacteraceae bacterium SCN 69-48]|nr:MAG: hypothetical protein ABS98_12795 [Xanthomonadaceae bacterium SCN 69-48]
MPAGWQRWFDAQPQADAGAARAYIEAWVAPLAERLTYAAQGRAARLGLPFFHLQRLARPHDPRDGRVLRIGVGAADIVLHLLLAATLLWLMYLHLAELARQDDEPGQVVQVHFIGRGNAQAGGGAVAEQGAQGAPLRASPASRRMPAPAQEAAAASAQPSETAVPPAVEQVALPQQQSIDASRPVPQLEQVPTPPEARQVLQVSEVPQPQPDGFKLPPPRERSVVLPQATLREAHPRPQVESLPMLETPAPRALQPLPQQAQLRAPELREKVRDIEVFRPDARLQARERTAPTADATAQVRVPRPVGQVRELPLKPDPGGAAVAAPERGNAPAGGGARAASAGAGQVQAGSGQGVRTAKAGGRGVAATGAGAGPGLKPAPGGWPGAAKSDDWGASQRNVAGTGNGDGREGDGKSGLFNADGSARLPDEWSRQDGLDLDRAGTWLKRPGLEYRGTRFDKYWIPQGTLLQEWVRRGIKELSIPIPGTGLKLKCVVSLLQFGGGCMPVDPDVNEQSSTGRAAPAVPFKPELQEDNGSVRPAPVPAENP